MWLTLLKFIIHITSVVKCKIMQLDLKEIKLNQIYFIQFASGVTILDCSFAKLSHNPLGVNFIKRFSMFSKDLLKFSSQVHIEEFGRNLLPYISKHIILFYNIKNIYNSLKCLVTNTVIVKWP